ncbi:MAG TPA: hypothetical protein PK867_31315, partial [Pirellulales bacterium]|nr:hypothetical protein [Pirellulales bacterium]
IHQSTNDRALAALQGLHGRYVRQRTRGEAVFFGETNQQVGFQEHRVFRVSDFIDFAARQMDLERGEGLYPQHRLNWFGIHAN